MSDGIELLSNSDTYLKTPLYQEIDLNSFIDEEKVKFIRSVEHPSDAIDAYCVSQLITQMQKKPDPHQKPSYFNQVTFLK